MPPVDVLIFALVTALLVFWAIGAHNRVTALRNAVHAAWPAVDMMLEQRGATLGTLAEALRARPPSEATQLEMAAVSALQAALAQVRSGAAAVRQRPSSRDAIAGLSVAESALGPALTRVLETIDRDDALRDAADVAQPRRDAELQAPRFEVQRQAFNQAVEAYNDAVGQFPTRLLMPLLRFARAGNF